MHGIRGFFLCLALSLWGLPVLAQWSGSADLSGGLGGMSGSIASDDKPMFHGLVKGTFMLNYKTEKFNWTTTLNGNWEPNTTDNSRLALKNERLGTGNRLPHLRNLQRFLHLPRHPLGHVQIRHRRLPDYRESDHR